MESGKMDNISKQDIIEFLYKILGPVAITVMSKLAQEYKRSKIVTWVSGAVITAFDFGGCMVGIWISTLSGFTGAKMALTSFTFGMLADKLFEMLFSKTILNRLCAVLQDAIVAGMKSIIGNITGKKD
jgi:hypothetical protein